MRFIDRAPPNAQHQLRRAGTVSCMLLLGQLPFVIGRAASHLGLCRECGDNVISAF